MDRRAQMAALAQMRGGQGQSPEELELQNVGASLQGVAQEGQLPPGTHADVMAQVQGGPPPGAPPPPPLAGMPPGMEAQINQGIGQIGDHVGGVAQRMAQEFGGPAQEPPLASTDQIRDLPPEIDAKVRMALQKLRKYKAPVE